MYKLNHLQYAKPEDIQIDKNISIQPLAVNFEYEKLSRELKSKFNFHSLNTFSFTTEGFLSFMLQLDGKISVSLGESDAIVCAAKQYVNLGFKIDFISLNKDGSLDYKSVKKCDYAFVSSYSQDTYVKNDLEKIATISEAYIIANVSAQNDSTFVDVALFDAYKLTGFATSCIALHNSLLKEQPLGQIDTIAISLINKAVKKEEFVFAQKTSFIKALEAELKDDFFFFVKPSSTLENTLHFGLKGIKAREIIRTLSLDSIMISNGEGCSLGLSRPSTIIQAMGYSELEAREAISLSFDKNFEDKEIEKIAKTIAKKYRQIKALNA